MAVIIQESFLKGNKTKAKPKSIKKTTTQQQQNHKPAKQTNKTHNTQQPIFKVIIFIVQY